MKYSSPIGKIFGYLTVIKRLDNEHRDRRYLCLCRCGKTTFSSISKLYKNKRTSCGCIRGQFINGRLRRICPDGQYAKYRIRNLTDPYIKALLCKETELKSKDMPDLLVKAKREQIQLYRLLKEQKNGREKA